MAGGTRLLEDRKTPLEQANQHLTHPLISDIFYSLLRPYSSIYLSLSKS
jgi:hypothetical protein